MTARKLLALVLVVGMVISTAGATAIAQTNSTPTPAVADQDTADGASDAGSGNTTYTRLYVDDRHERLRLEPGETDSFTITVQNGEDESVDVSPKVFIPPRGERPVEKSWVTIEDGDTTLAPGEEREFEVTVSVPEDAEINRYGGVIAFTDETVTYPGQPERPVHGVSLSVEVWQEPTVNVVSDRHTYTQVKAGESFTREIVIENTGEEAVPVNPQVKTQDRHRPPHRSGGPETLDRSWLAIDAPTEIEPGETATVEVTVSPPADAERGDYRAALDLGLKDPARPEDDTHWQEHRIRFQVWEQPDDPFETSFEVSEETESVTLELSAGGPRHGTTEMAPPNFDVTFVAPNGTEVDAERVQVTNHGSVTLGHDRPQPATDDATYSTSGENQRFRYRVEEPDAGSWSVRITPDNTMRFSYEITRDERS